jgi:hypothetical protein
MRFHVQLTGNSQVDAFAEKVFGVIDSSNDLFFDWFGRIDVVLGLGGSFGTAFLFLL